MEKAQLSGDLSELPFPFVLFRLWNSNLTGTLEVETKPRRTWEFKKGDICVRVQQVQNSDLLTRFLKAKQAKLPKKTGSSGTLTLKEILESGSFTPGQLWQELRALVSEDAFAIFDRDSGSYSFRAEGDWEEHEILFYIPVTDLILEGIRGMANQDLVEAHMPKPDQSLKLLYPEYLQEIALNGPEIYLYHVVKKHSSLPGIMDASPMGKSATQKILYTLLALGIVGLPRTASLDHILSGEISQADIYHLLERFNRTLAYIYKYISKEIGPASLNVLEKCLEETKPSLSELFQNFRFDREGRIEISSVPITSAGVQGRQLKRSVLQDLNEILAAEILAVKRILGNAHEAALINNLRRING